MPSRCSTCAQPCCTVWLSPTSWWCRPTPFLLLFVFIVLAIQRRQFIHFNVIDYWLPLNLEGESLHLHVQPAVNRTLDILPTTLCREGSSPVCGLGCL